MNTNNDIVSKVIGSYRMNTKDGHISRRYVLKLLRDFSKNLLSKKLMDRTLALESNLYTKLECLEFEKVEVIKCPIIEFRMCRTLMKSKCKLPDPIFSRLGASITEIVSLDGMYELKLISAEQYRRNQKRKYSIDGEVYIYLAEDGYLYIPDEEIYSLNVTFMTLFPEEADECSECKKNDCKSGWDYPFVGSDKLDDVVFKEVLQILGSTYKSSQEDQNPNGIEGN
jgi:hypothetical protein